MRAHLNEDALMELVEGGGTPESRAHMGSCRDCGRRVDEARAAWDAALLSEVPEPPGLYWDALRKNVQRRIAEQPRQRTTWRWLLPVAATIGAVAVFVSLAGRTPWLGTEAEALPAWSALPPVEQDEDLALVSTFALEDDTLAEWDDGQELGALLAVLSEEESDALVEALRVDEGKGDL